MAQPVEINPRIGKKHPEISNSDVQHAWKNALVIAERIGNTLPDTVLVAVGSDTHGRLLEMVGVIKENDAIHIFHAMTPPSQKTLVEVGLLKERSKK